MPAAISAAKKKQLITLVRQGETMAEAARASGVSYAFAKNYLKKLTEGVSDSGEGWRTLRANDDTPPEPIPYDDLCPEAKRAWHDIAYFALRYFGAVAMPWQQMATENIVEYLDTDQKEYVVVNCPPGAGKTTYFTLIENAWLTVRNRAIRGMIVSNTQRNAENYLVNLRRALEQPLPIKASDNDIRLGIAVDAEASIVMDFGVFKTPGESGERWTAKAFQVMQHKGRPVSEKESTWQAFGKGGAFLGNRLDVIVCDDVYDRSMVKTSEARDDFMNWFDKHVETRLEPNGLLLLVGQRQDADDVYRHCVSVNASVATDRGPVPICDVRPGDRVLTREGYREVTYSASQGWKQTLRLTTESGHVLDLTGDHRVAVPGGWLPAARLGVGMPLLVCGSGVDPDATPATTTFATHEVGVLSGVGVPSVAVGAFHEGADAIRPPHVASVVLADEMFWTDARRIGAQVAGLVSLGDGVSGQVELPNDHPADQLLVGVGVMPSLGVPSEAGTASPHLTFADPFGAGRKPFTRERLPRSNSGAGSTTDGPRGFPAATVDAVRSITHSATVEVWDLTVKETPEFYANGILVHNCLDKVVLIDEDGDDIEHEADAQKKYHHVVFKAHYDELCTKDHKGVKPYPEGCLLYPGRIKWRDIRGLTSDVFAVEYQQEDVAPGGVLVDPLWVSGGRDPLTHIEYQGAWDRDRDEWQFPNVQGDLFVMATVDPSPTQYWALQVWAIHKASEQRFLIASRRQKMTAPDLLDFRVNEGRFVGLMDEWQRTSAELKHPIRYWVLENNAAQKFMMQYDLAQKWKALHGVQIVPHTTTWANKSDPKLGVESLRGLWEQGRVRLPGYAHGRGRLDALALVAEVTKWPQGRTDDTVMAHWFAEWNFPRLYAPVLDEPYRVNRPSWVGSTKLRSA